jgi:hypothetical protein
VSCKKSNSKIARRDGQNGADTQAAYTNATMSASAMTIVKRSRGHFRTCLHCRR